MRYTLCMITSETLSKLLAEGLAQGAFPSAVAAVGRCGVMPSIGTAGPVNIHTRYDMASMSKIMGPTMLALRALEAGSLSLDDPLSKFFDAPADKADITVFQLMTHTGGFTPAFWLFEETDDPADAAGCILRHPLEARPDGTPRYSCMGYILLGKILEQVYAGPLDAIARVNVFSPLGMVNTGYCPVGDNIAPTERDPQTGIALCGVVHDENARFLRGVSGNAGVFSDIADCVRLAAMLATGGSQYLSAETLRSAIHNYTPGKEAHRGLGFHLGGIAGTFMGSRFPASAFGHTGFTGTSLVIDPQTGLYAVLLTNSVHVRRQNEALFAFRRRFHDLIYEIYEK